MGRLGTMTSFDTLLRVAALSLAAALTVGYAINAEAQRQSSFTAPISAAGEDRYDSLMNEFWLMVNAHKKRSSVTKFLYSIQQKFDSLSFIRQLLGLLRPSYRTRESAAWFLRGSLVDELRDMRAGVRMSQGVP